MLDLVLRRRSLAFRLTVKGAISVLCVVLAVALPQMTHAIGGVEAGSLYMPMYMPALLAGCLIGWQWGLGVGLLSPVASMGFSTIFLGSAMPNATRLPYMVLEIGAYGLVSGLFAKLIEKNPLYSFPAVILGQISGRAIYVIYNLIAGREFAALWASVQTSLLGLYIQAILVPAIVIALCMVIKREQKS